MSTSTTSRVNRPTDHVHYSTYYVCPTCEQEAEIRDYNETYDCCGDCHEHVLDWPEVTPDHDNYSGGEWH